MAGQKRPSIRRRRLSAELKRARKEAGLSIEQVAKITEWSVGKISNLESGVKQYPSVMEIKGFLDTYGVTDPARREFILNLTRRAKERGWWSKYTDVFTDEFPVFEAEASSIYTFELTRIPGLFQTPGYVELLMRASLHRSPLDIDRAIETRKQRQTLLDRPKPPELWTVIDEAALRRIEPATAVFHEQVQHLIDIAEADNSVTIQILPFASGMHAGLAGPFVILDFGELTSPIAYLETDTDDLLLDEREEVDRYRKLFDHVRTSARHADASLQLLKNLIQRQ